MILLHLVQILGSILAPKCPDVWDGLNKQKWIYFIGVKNLIIEGHGVVNGMGREWWVRSCKVNTTNVLLYFLPMVSSYALSSFYLVS